jgi:hypothetical protein
MEVQIGGVDRRLILDTGSSISLIHPDVAVGDMLDADVSPIGVAGATMCIDGVQEVEFRLQNCTFHHPYYVCELPTEMDGIVGTDLLRKLRARLDLGDCSLVLKGGVGPQRTR